MSYRLAFTSLVSAGFAWVVLGAGCVDATSTDTIERAVTGVDVYGLDWAKHDVDLHDGSWVIRADVQINAPVAKVWALVRNPNGYAAFNKALTARADVVAVGQPITLDIRLFGDALPPTSSTEAIEIIDDDLHVASWSRDFGLGQATHRPQLLEPQAGGTHYYTALKLPPSLAWLVGPLFATGIHDAFARFADGLKAAAEAP